MSGTRFFGKYRGTVTTNVDPQMQGRVQVSVPAVYGTNRSAWAMPCVPYAGPGVGLFAVPPVGANVWVEFEAGNPDYPIWVGGFWGLGEAPASPAVAEMKVFKSDGVSVTVSDLPGAGGLTIEVGPPAVAVPMKLAFTASGIELSMGAAKVALTPASVSINDGALEVI